MIIEICDDLGQCGKIEKERARERVFGSFWCL